MIEFTWPFVILLLPAPFILRWIIFAKDKKTSGYSLKVPFFTELARMNKNRVFSHSTNIFRLLLLMTIWVLLVLAAARPIEIADSWSIDVEGRDLMIAIDASGSMDRPETVDEVITTRFNIVKEITSELVDRRKGDRVGLIIFGTKAFLYSPLSFDTSLVKNFISDTFAGMAGPSTAIGDALMLSVKYLHDRPTKNKVLLLMTDGANQGGRYSVEQGVARIKRTGIKVYTIGIGFSDNDGKNPIKKEAIDLDEPALISIAKESNGQYFRVNSAADLAKVFDYIEQLEKIDESLTKQSVDEIYYIFVLWAIGIAVFMLMFHIFMVYKTHEEDVL